MHMPIQARARVIVERRLGPNMFRLVYTGPLGAGKRGGFFVTINFQTD